MDMINFSFVPHPLNAFRSCSQSSATEGTVSGTLRVDIVEGTEKIWGVFASKRKRERKETKQREKAGLIFIEAHSFATPVHRGPLDRTFLSPSLPSLFSRPPFLRLPFARHGRITLLSLFFVLDFSVTHLPPSSSGPLPHLHGAPTTSFAGSLLPSPLRREPLPPLLPPGTPPLRCLGCRGCSHGP